MDMNANVIIESAKSVYDEAVSFRRILHENPELSGEEYKTLAFIREYLDAQNIEYVTYSNGGICALIGKGERAIGVRGDVDALPVEEKTGLPYASKNKGVMHACGHDVHTAVLMGAAKIFKSMENELPCMVKLFFQPAEESIGGANVMVREGCMENPKVDAVLGIHVDPETKLGACLFTPGKMNAAVIEMEIKVRGKSCHGAHPEQGRDAIVAAAQIISSLQTVNSRLTAPTTPVVVTIGTIEGGSKNNIIAGEVNMTGTVRVLDMETAKTVKDHIKQIISGVALSCGVEAEVELIDDYPALVNDFDVTMAVSEEAKRILGTENVIINQTPSMGGDDFAYFANASKGCYFNIGTAKEGEKKDALHSETYAPDESCILTGLEVVTAGVLKLSEKPL